jgi:hypothetical protein
MKKCQLYNKYFLQINIFLFMFINKKIEYEKSLTNEEIKK